MKTTFRNKRKFKEQDIFATTTFQLTNREIAKSRLKDLYQVFNANTKEEKAKIKDLRFISKLETGHKPKLSENARRTLNYQFEQFNKIPLFNEEQLYKARLIAEKLLYTQEKTIDKKMKSKLSDRDYHTWKNRPFNKWSERIETIYGQTKAETDFTIKTDKNPERALKYLTSRDAGHPYSLINLLLNQDLANIKFFNQANKVMKQGAAFDEYIDKTGKLATHMRYDGVQKSINEIYGLNSKLTNYFDVLLTFHYEKKIILDFQMGNDVNINFKDISKNFKNDIENQNILRTITEDLELMTAIKEGRYFGEVEELIVTPSLAQRFYETLYPYYRAIEQAISTQRGD